MNRPVHGSAGLTIQVSNMVVESKGILPNLIQLVPPGRKWLMEWAGGPKFKVAEAKHVHHLQPFRISHLDQGLSHGQAARSAASRRWYKAERYATTGTGTGVRLEARNFSNDCGLQGRNGHSPDYHRQRHIDRDTIKAGIVRSGHRQPEQVRRSFTTSRPRETRGGGRGR